MARHEHLIAAGLVGLLAVAAAGCERAAQTPPGAEETPGAQAPVAEETSEPLVAGAELSGLPGSDVFGVVTFTQEEDEVRVVARVQGAEPGLHGFHLHETGQCDPPDFASAGDHFDPTGAQHGGPEFVEHHAGDFGNIEVAEDGTGHLDLRSEMLTVEEGPRSVLGKAVILHAGEDDLESQPSGDAGGRLACGVVERVAGELQPQQGPDEPPEEVRQEIEDDLERGQDE